MKLLRQRKDLEIKGGGSESLIRDKRATGSTLKIGADSLVLQNKDGNENYIECTDNGSVKIYHDFLPKLETTSTGLQLTGNLLPEANNTRDIGASATVFANVYATTFRGNVNIASGTSTFNNLTLFKIKLKDVKS